MEGWRIKTSGKVYLSQPPLWDGGWRTILKRRQKDSRTKRREDEEERGRTEGREDSGDATEQIRKWREGMAGERGQIFWNCLHTHRRQAVTSLCFPPVNIISSPVSRQQISWQPAGKASFILVVWVCVVSYTRAVKTPKVLILYLHYNFNYTFHTVKLWLLFLKSRYCVVTASWYSRQSTSGSILPSGWQ